MRFKDTFSIIGPSMVGPSSSHTAGAVRIGRVARQIFGGLPQEAEIVLYKSFAETYRGHGTDSALAAGLLDFDTDDARIRDALKLAEEAGVRIVFRKGENVSVHPNTALLILRGEGREDRIMGASIGGGNIEITSVNDFDVKATMLYPTMILFHNDRPGMLGEVTSLLGKEGVNIGYMDVDRKSRRGDALSVMETDEAISDELIEKIERMPSVKRIAIVDLAANEVRE
ncbi:L-serine dehydratase, iron-sulfur-dependent subunit beta [Paenibacillus sp. FSL H8-0548]|uniref:L-serine ammonia-lyase, iron-sulfur-dependent subunit beta n=1 Tax=Paenibacillus sp. FSL H8-0548 TaxID=1920422 RepID=UPI00096E9478|nr:L-serine ammonia-lyase, iron-sulfur-dependent subunit beta [Paenibacillus sp. FSL H8-0548]OMF24428.1 L-serine dehydratase, iron-sulfur-dependent subunit beta [Paenibacillus sp. FSL H8-0548]